MTPPQRTFSLSIINLNLNTVRPFFRLLWRGIHLKEGPETTLLEIVDCKQVNGNFQYQSRLLRVYLTPVT